eukprot:UN21193
MMVPKIFIIQKCTFQAFYSRVEHFFITPRSKLTMI